MEKDPGQVAVLDHDIYASRASGSLAVRSSTTAREMWDDVLGLAVALKELGIERGDVVALQLPNWHEWLTTHLALYAIGAVTMPISPVFRTRDVSRQLAVADVRALVLPASFGSFDFLAMGAELQRTNPGIAHVIAIGDVGDRPVQSWSELVRVGSSSDHDALRDEIAEGRHANAVDDFMLLNFTSGTTGEPKGVMHTTTTISSVVGAAAERLELSSEDLVFVAVTLGHAGGFLNGIYLPLLLGSPIVYLDLWDAGFALEVIQRERITYGPAMPPFLLDMINHPDFATTDISSWRTARVSGGVMPRHVIAALHRQIPTIRLCPGWGMSELSYVTCGSPDDPIEKMNYTDGRPLGPCEIQIRDETCTQELPVGEPGEIVVRSSGLTLGYIGRDELTKASITADGWFKSGDIGKIDAEGYLTVVGRSKDIILRGAENVPVIEVELAITEHPQVNAVALIGVPDERLGERVCAVIEFVDREQPLTVEELRDFLVSQEMTRQFIPEYVVPIGALPRTPSGKIRKMIVRDQIAPQFAEGTTTGGISSAGTAGQPPTSRPSDGQNGTP
ncbi:MAG TPA: AMP-binding protein [Nocardioides sp.]|nr:AMP-binding protein [Nocardioides sp.]